MAMPPVEPEVLSLIAPASFSPLRLFLSLVILLIFLLIAFFSPRSSSRTPLKKHTASRTVLLVGPLASGKTSLFSKLVYGHAPPTHTSMEENEGLVKAKWGTGEPPTAVALSRPLHLVDLPGHPRLRTRALAQFLPAADGLVFAIDGVTGLSGKNVRDAGEHLHVLLSLLSFLSSRRSAPLPPLLILLTKSDQLTSSTSTPTKPKSASLTLDRAKQSLARELERRRAASAAGGTSAGAKLEGLDAIQTGGSGSSSSAFKSLLAALGLLGSSASTTTTLITPGAAGLPSDEVEVLANEDAFAFEGAFEWGKVEQTLGLEINWAVASSKDVSEAGLDKVWEWVDEL
ncbi:SPOSA6832_01581 [Sporobolomyces salmonicolor]|uniref:Signal recognition particle receptor subunit beta n=1 Tax=Sporidiobolus salmonicolor TaxID=5005 RepID=A0A0D6EK31_SPOSA|nr:SPOSA6832_01581 [Sporobolomyces salmonicolor]